MPLTDRGINLKELYDAIVDFAQDDNAKETYYQMMDTPTGRVNSDGSEETVRDRVLKAYAMLFCEDADIAPGEKAGVDDVADTADRLYIGGTGYDPEHWYRMKYHFPVIDEDNYDRFAALVISDMNSGPLHDAAVNDGETLVIGEADPLHMTPAQRKNQSVKSVGLSSGGAN